jgi:cysteinyl-tRNA synthetase
MPLRLFNTLTKSKDEFTPLDPKNVRMYVCGPTVYDFAHIGNARPAIVFDLLYRLLRHEYGADHVTYVRNITDVDDKINARALRDFPGLPLNQAIRNVTEKTEVQYHADVAALGCLPPTHEPRATEHISGMVTIIAQLLARGHAYQAAGEVLFDTQSMPDYGRLSGRRLEEQQAGARIEVDAHKKHPNDFVLWKLSDDNEPGWESPWGRGRPGWHIECSAMSAHHLGNVFDIHGGGLDLIFPHHENEIAQSRCAHGTPVMANVWMHNGFLQVEGEKMSKSLGNFVTIRQLLTDWNGFKWPGAVARFAMLMTHYRQPINWSLQRMEEAAIALDSFRHFSMEDEGVAPSEAVIDALCDDLNTPLAIAELYKLLEEAKNPVQQVGGAAAVLWATCKFLGLNTEEVDLNKLFRAARVQIGDDEIHRAIEARKAARAAKNFAESDRIRDELLSKGIVLKDGPQGTTWEVKR